MRRYDVSGIRSDMQQVIPDCVAKHYESVMSAEIVAGKRSVPEMSFMRDDIVQNGYDLAPGLRMPCDISL